MATRKNVVRGKAAKNTSRGRGSGAPGANAYNKGPGADHAKGGGAGKATGKAKKGGGKKNVLRGSDPYAGRP